METANVKPPPPLRRTESSMSFGEAANAKPPPPLRRTESSMSFADDQSALIERYLGELDNLYQAALSGVKDAFYATARSLQDANRALIEPIKAKAQEADDSPVKESVTQIASYLQDVLIHKQIIVARKILDDPLDENWHSQYWKILGEITDKARQAMVALDNIEHRVPFGGGGGRGRVSSVSSSDPPSRPDSVQSSRVDDDEPDPFADLTPAEGLTKALSVEWERLVEAAREGDVERAKDIGSRLARMRARAVDAITAEVVAGEPDFETRRDTINSCDELAELLSLGVESAEDLAAEPGDAALADELLEYDQTTTCLLAHVYELIATAREEREDLNDVGTVRRDSDELSRRLQLLSKDFMEALAAGDRARTVLAAGPIEEATMQAWRLGDLCLEETDEEPERRALRTLLDDVKLAANQLKVAVSRPECMSNRSHLKNLWTRGMKAVTALFERLVRNKAAFLKNRTALRQRLRKALDTQKRAQAEIWSLQRSMEKETDAAVRAKVKSELELLRLEFKQIKLTAIEERQKTEHDRERTAKLRLRRQKKAEKPQTTPRRNVEADKRSRQAELEKEVQQRLARSAPTVEEVKKRLQEQPKAGLAQVVKQKQREAEAEKQRVKELQDEQARLERQQQEERLRKIAAVKQSMKPLGVKTAARPVTPSAMTSRSGATTVRSSVASQRGDERRQQQAERQQEQDQQRYGRHLNVPGMGGGLPGAGGGAGPGAGGGAPGAGGGAPAGAHLTPLLTASASTQIRTRNVTTPGGTIVRPKTTSGVGAASAAAAATTYTVHLQPLQRAPSQRALVTSQSIPLSASTKASATVVMRPRTTGGVPTAKSQLSATPRPQNLTRKMSLTNFAPWEVATFTSPLPPLGMHTATLDWGE